MRAICGYVGISIVLIALSFSLVCAFTQFGDKPPVDNQVAYTSRVYGFSPVRIAEFVDA